MRSNTIKDINKEIIHIQDNLRVLERRHESELLKLEQETYKLIVQEIQLKLIGYIQSNLVSLQNKIKGKQSVEEELALLQDIMIRFTSKKISSSIKEEYKNLASKKELEPATIKYIDELMEYLSDDNLKLTVNNLNFYKHIDSIINLAKNPNNKSELSLKMSLLDRSIKETNKEIGQAKIKTNTLQAQFKSRLDGIVTIENAIKNTLDEGAELINTFQNSMKKFENIDKKKIINDIQTHKNQISLFSSAKKIALEKLIDSINNATNNKGQKSLTLESLISNWLFTYEKIIKRTSITKQLKKAWSGELQESSTEKFIRELRENYGHIRIDPTILEK